MLAGRRQIFVRLCGCNLTCAYCDTEHEAADHCSMETAPGSNVFSMLPQPINKQLLLDTLTQWHDAMPGAHHSISITGGEPLMSAEVLTDWLPDMRCIMPVHLETNGTLHLELARVIGHLDYVSMDMKLPSTAACGTSLWHEHRLFLEQARATQVSVKIVAGDKTSEDEIVKVCEIIQSVDSRVPLFLQPLTLAGGKVGISAVHLLHLQQVAASLLPDVRVIPQMHRLLGVF